MSKPEGMSFVDAVAEGLESADKIDDYVEAWHAGKIGGELHDALGMNEREYHAWVLNPDALEHIVALRRMIKNGQTAITAAVAKERGLN